MDWCRVDDPEAVLVRASRCHEGDRFRVAVSVIDSTQDPRDAAVSLRDAIFILEQLAPAFGNAEIVAQADEDNPNNRLLVLDGEVHDLQRVRSFVQQWRDVLDPDGSGEPFIVSSDEAATLFDRLDGDEPQRAFRFPQLVTSYRDIRRSFDEWDD